VPDRALRHLPAGVFAKSGRGLPAAGGHGSGARPGLLAGLTGRACSGGSPEGLFDQMGAAVQGKVKVVPTNQHWEP
jgi:hypothetical protein